jgi:carboxymethylenebutenolidase
LEKEGNMEASSQEQHNIRRQLAILEVAAQADGESTDEIVGMLRAAMARHRVSAPTDIWLKGVARDASLGVAYVVSTEAMEEARARMKRSRLDGTRSLVAEDGAGLKDEALADYALADDDGATAGAMGGGLDVAHGPGQDPAAAGADVAAAAVGPAGAPSLHQVTIDTPVPGRTERLRGFLGVPAGSGPWPAVVMIHEAFAIDAVMLRQVERMAQAGYLVLMPDLFSAGGPRRCLAATFRALSARQGRAFDDIEAARQWLLGRADSSGAVGILGFCMGGGFALVAASRGFDVASVNYGSVPRDISEVLQGACPVVGSYGAKDRLVRAVPRLEAALEEQGIDHDVRVYPDAGHAFLNDAPTGPALLQPVLKLISGAGPDPEAAADAWHRIEEFFRKHLVEAPLPGAP